MSSPLRLVSPLTPDLGELLAQSAQGSQEAFSDLYDMTSSRVYGLALAVVKNSALAEEITQETYLSIWNTCSAYESTKGSPLSWILTITHRKAVDKVRSVQAQQTRDTKYHAKTTDTLPDVAEQVVSHDRATRVHKALQQLPETQKEVLVLAYFDGLTHTQIAEKLRLPLGTAKGRIRDGLLRLRKNLGEDND